MQGRIETKIWTHSFNEYEVKTIVTGQFRLNTYLVFNKQKETLFIIDPGFDAEAILYEISSISFNEAHLLLTHGHFDHIESAHTVMTKLNIPLYVSKKDLRLIKKADLYSQTFANRKIQTPNSDRINCYEECKPFEDFKIMYTPGHTRGGVCLIFKNFVFVGDTLMNGRAGFSGFPEGSSSDLKNSISTLMKTITDDSLIFLGHGKPWETQNAKIWWSQQLSQESIDEDNVFS